MKRIYLFVTVFIVLIISVAVVASVMFMKPVTKEPEGGDDDTTGPDETTGPDDTTSEEPAISGFDFRVETGTFWSYFWRSEYNEAVQGSSGVHSVTSGNLIITLGEAIEVDGITAYKTEIRGDTTCHDFEYTLRWTHLAVSDNQILGSDDNGASLKTIFDARTGVWQGGGFFLNFPNELHVQPSQTRIENEYINTSAYCVSVSRSEGGNYYDPVTGITIYSSDERWSTDGKEFYKGGLGLVGYSYYYGWSDSGGNFFSSFSWKRELGLVDSSLTASDGFVPEKFTTWVRKADMPTPRYNHAASVVDGVIYVIGGFGEDHTEPLDTVEAYDPATDTWTTKASVPFSFYSITSVAIDDWIYVFSDDVEEEHRYYNTPSLAVRIYDSVTDSWSTVGTLRSEADSSGIYPLRSTIFDNRYLVLYTGNHLLIYDTELEPGSVLLLEESSPPHYLGTHPGLATDSTHVYVISEEYTYRYTPFSSEQGDPWERLASMKYDERDDVVAIMLDGLVYVIGGYSDSEGKLRIVEAYDPELDVWTEKSQMGTPRDCLTASVVNGKIYAIGGGEYSPKSVVEEYDPLLD